MVDPDRQHNCEFGLLSAKIKSSKSFERSPSAKFETAIARLSPLSRNRTRKIFSQDEGKFGGRPVQSKTANILWLKSTPTNPGQLVRTDAKSEKG